MTERYHGSAVRASLHNVWRPVRDGTVEFFRAHFRPHADRLPDGVPELLEEAEVAYRAEDWPAALAIARKAASIVEDDGRVRARRVVGNLLLPLGDVGRALRLLAEPARLTRAREWHGEDLTGRRLFVRQLHMTNMGAPIRMGRFIAGALARTDRVVVVVERRLVPIFRRSFPDAEVRASTPLSLLDAGHSDFVTSFEGLGGHLVSDWPSVAGTFVPLRADEPTAAELRRRYRGDHAAPLVGVSWGSTNDRKPVPPIALWAELAAASPVGLVSLQYGSIGPALDLIRAGEDRRLLYDPSVDQLADMDRFAAQVAALDAVVTVSNTGAHLTAAMGKPVVMIMSDGRRGYPADGEESWWYPKAVLLRRRGREWKDVMEEGRARLSAMLAGGRASV